GVEVGAVDLFNDVGPGQVQDVVAPQERVGMIAKPVAAKIILLEVVPHEHRAHRAVEDHDSLREDSLETCPRIAHIDHPECRPWTASAAVSSRMPTTWRRQKVPWSLPRRR